MSYNPSSENSNTKNNISPYVDEERTLLIKRHYLGCHNGELFKSYGFELKNFNDEIINLVSVSYLDDILGQYVLYTLPIGWKMEYNGRYSLYYTFIIRDQNGHKRGTYYSWLSNYGKKGDKTGEIYFLPKFRTTRHHTNESVMSPVIVSIKDSDDNILYTAGKANHLSKEYYELLSKAREFLENKYPECEKAYFYTSFPMMRDYSTGCFYTKLDKYWD